jgi:MarR family transcriptional regulator, organic hydroperoxide resistance regulator
VEEKVSAACEDAQRCLQHYDLNWLLNRAAHQLREAMDHEATAHGITIRGQIVLTAIVQSSYNKEVKPLSQLALSTLLGLDKTTMTAVLDKLEGQGLLVRTPDPNDRRARIPVATEAGRELQNTLYHKLQAIEEHMMSDLSAAERDQLRDMLRRIIGSKPVDGGSCV